MDMETSLADIASGKARPTQSDSDLIAANRLIFGEALVDPNPDGLPEYASMRAQVEQEFWRQAVLLSPVSRARALQNIRDDFNGRFK